MMSWMFKQDKADAEPEAPTYQGKPLTDWIAQLQDKDRDIRIKAVQALDEIAKRDEQLPEAVLRALAQALSDKDKVVRFVASEALKWSPHSERATPFRLAALQEAIKADDVTLRRDAATYLGQVGTGQPEAVIPVLSEVLMKDRDAEVRQNAAFALGRFGKAAVPALIAVLKSANTETRRLTVKSFRGMGRNARPGIPVLAELLQDDDTELRCEIASVLMVLGDEAGEALPALLLASKIPDSGGDVAREALERIRKAPRSTAPALIALLKNEEPYIRLKAAEVLCDMEEGDKECLACLLELIKRRDSKIRRGAAQLLARYGSAAKGAVPALIEVLRTDLDIQTRVPAISALGNIGPDAKEAVPLLKALQDDPQFGGYAKHALKMIDL